MANRPAEFSTDSLPSLAFDARRGAQSAAVSTAQERVRRAFDIVLSLVALLVFSPVMLAIAILIRLDSPGPILFRHVRIGRSRRSRKSPVRRDRRQRDSGGPPFVFYKFRTMYADARERFPELYTYKYTADELATLPIK